MNQTPPLPPDSLQAWSARPLSSAEREGYLDWALDFFTDETVAQDPFVDITLQLDVTEAHAAYRAQSLAGLSFFSFLIWHLAQAMQGQPDFQLRRFHTEWWVLENAPIVVPVAIGGAQRFTELLLENTTRLSLADFAGHYRQQLDAARRGELPRLPETTFLAACFIGNLPQLRFSGLSLHWRQSRIQCQPGFYFGQRYEQGGRLLIPMAAKLHHACTDPHVLNALITDFQQRFA
ncbi:CatA-like O-acetyltransferase [Uliginosibacterium sp. 31-12]|uniref:CatA-like O-acetyltransferase n=1 Tax=Uliginosibacterium sp. 31-12 TaxID=3062781 RepID=UPI0026E37207|nr:CatA-like O-acetyltransferase [Uliginosibacterium sp. 31-12]MDO6387316.1 CatA-like O-acetyltransferase [Uliginosibacterium sp. 31-12]